MSTSVYPPLSPSSLVAAEKLSTARELEWLLTSLQETLLDLKSGLDECYALLAPLEPGSTLVLSSPRSESIKGHVTRVGTLVVKGQIVLKLKTHPPITLQLNPKHTTPLPIPALVTLRGLINQSLDCIDITRWTGDKHSASFISSQFLLLSGLLSEALTVLRGPVTTLLPIHGHSGHTTPRPSTSSSSSTSSPKPPPFDSPAPLEETPWTLNPPPPSSFLPELPPSLSIHLSLTSPTLHLTIRVLEPVATPQHTFSKFAYAIGAQRRLEHDEMEEVFVYRGEEVRVREKVRVESAADPGLLSLEAKLVQLGRVVEGVRGGLGVVMGGM